MKVESKDGVDWPVDTCLVWPSVGAELGGVETVDALSESVEKAEEVGTEWEDWLCFELVLGWEVDRVWVDKEVSTLAPFLDVFGDLVVVGVLVLVGIKLVRLVVKPSTQVDTKRNSKI